MSSAARQSNWNCRWVCSNPDGIGRDGILYEYKSATGADGIYVPGGWAAIMGSDTKPTNGFFALAANTVGTVFALDKIGSVYAKGEAGVSDALKTTVTGTADGVLVDPKAGATTAAGETVEGLLVKLKVIAELFKTTDDTTVSADDLTIIKQIGQQLSAFTPPAPKTATQPATPSDVAKSPDTPPTKEEQVDQQKDTKAGTPEPTPTISQPATGRGGRPTTNPRAAGASGLNRVNRITGSGAASSTRPGLSTRPTTTGQRPRPGASPRPGVQRPGATTSAGSATSQRPTRPSGSSASSARPSTVRPTASRPGTATRPGVQRPGASSSSTRPTGSRPTSRR